MTAPVELMRSLVGRTQELAEIPGLLGVAAVAA